MLLHVGQRSTHKTFKKPKKLRPLAPHPPHPPGHSVAPQLPRSAGLWPSPSGLAASAGAAPTWSGRCLAEAVLEAKPKGAKGAAPLGIPGEAVYSSTSPTGGGAVLEVFVLGLFLFVLFLSQDFGRCW